MLEVSAAGSTVAEAAAGPEAAARFEPEPSAEQTARGTLEVAAEGSAVAEAAAGPSAQASFKAEPAAAHAQARALVAPSVLPSVYLLLYTNYLVFHV